MLTPVSALHLRNALGTYLDRARLAGETFVITRNGREIAVLFGPKEYAALITRLEELGDHALPIIEIPAAEANKQQ